MDIQDTTRAAGSEDFWGKLGNIPICSSTMDICDRLKGRSGLGTGLAVIEKGVGVASFPLRLVCTRLATAFPKTANGVNTAACECLDILEKHVPALDELPDEDTPQDTPSLQEMVIAQLINLWKYMMKWFKPTSLIGRLLRWVLHCLGFSTKEVQLWKKGDIRHYLIPLDNETDEDDTSCDDTACEFDREEGEFATELLTGITMTPPIASSPKDKTTTTTSTSDAGTATECTSEQKKGLSHEGFIDREEGQAHLKFLCGEQDLDNYLSDDDPDYEQPDETPEQSTDEVSSDTESDYEVEVDLTHGNLKSLKFATELLTGITMTPPIASSPKDKTTTTTSTSDAGTATECTSEQNKGLSHNGPIAVSANELAMLIEIAKKDEELLNSMKALVSKTTCSSQSPMLIGKCKTTGDSPAQDNPNTDP